MAERIAVAAPAQQPARRVLSLSRRNSLLGYGLVAPVVLCLLVLVFYPFAFAVWISFTNRTIGTEGSFIGLTNFVYLFNNPSFQATVQNTLVLVVAVQAIKLVFGLGIALLLNQNIRGRNIWRGLILLPWAMPAFVAFLTWKLLYAPQGGAFNLILVGLGLVDNQVDFLSNKALAMPSVIVATFWRGFPFWVISFLAALQNVSPEQVRRQPSTARTPGAAFRHITLPGIRRRAGSAAALDHLDH